MGKKIFIGIYAILVLICATIIFNFIYNALIVFQYNRGDYSGSVRAIQVANWTQPYIAYYNEGNLEYQKGNYQNAMDYYNKALKYDMPEEKECSVRINIALTWVASTGDNYAAPENVEYSLQALYQARAVLLNEDCATEDGTGHSADAQKLKDEIDEIIKELEEQQSSSEEKDSEQDGEESNKEQENQEDSDAFEEDVKKAIEEKKAKANKERQEGLQYYEEIEQDYNFDSDGMIW